MKKIYISLLLVFALLTGCSQPAKTDTSSNSNQLKALTNAEFPPFESQTGDKKIVGFDADVLNALSQAGGFQTTLEHTGFDGIFEAIDRGKANMGIAAITITEERKQKYDFSDPYFDAKQVILLPANSPVKTLKELNGKKIGVQQSTTGETVVQDAFGKTYANLKGYDAIPSAIDDLKLGRLDAVVVDDAVVKDYLKKLGPNNFKLVEDPSIPVEQYGIAVKKGDKATLDKINAGLKKIKEDGTYQKIYDQYFKITP